MKDVTFHLLRCTGQFVERPLYVPYTCVYTCVIRVLYVCYTCVIRVLYVCYTCVIRVLYVCYTCVERVLNVCIVLWVWNYAHFIIYNSVIIGSLRRRKLTYCDV